MVALPSVSGRQARTAFEKLGWSYLRHHGSHMIMTKPDHRAVLSIPDQRSLGRGLQRSLIRDAEITVEDFIEALRA